MVSISSEELTVFLLTNVGNSERPATEDFENLGVTIDKIGVLARFGAVLLRLPEQVVSSDGD